MEYTIEKNGIKYNATQEQKDIMEFIAEGSGNAIIKAAAGSAKTTTIVNSLKYIPRDKKVMFIAFNQSVENAIRKEVSDEYSNVRVCTFHGLGYSMLRNNGVLKDPVINENKYTKYISDNLDNITIYKETKSLGHLRPTYKRNIIRLIEFARYFCVMKEIEITNLAKIYGFELVRDETAIVREALLWGKEHLNEIDYTDMEWLPNVLNLQGKFDTYDFIFVDEAQDITVAYEKLIDKSKKRGCRIIAVGDIKQRINEWCGASRSAFEKLENMPNTTQFTLSTSFRCPKKIVQLVREKFSDIDIKATDNAIDGEVNYDVNFAYVKCGGMVLSRQMAPLLDYFLKCSRTNKACYLKGWEDYKEFLYNATLGIESNIIDTKLITSNGLFPTLYKKLFATVDSLIANNGLSEEEAYKNDSVTLQINQINCLAVLSEGLRTVEELQNKIKMIYSGTPTEECVIFSTVHKAKGLEADDVYILLPSSMPSPLSRLEWEEEAEDNLIYVAWTRAKKTLNFIHENEYDRIKYLIKNKQFQSEMYDVKLRLSLNEENGMKISIPKMAQKPIINLGETSVRNEKKEKVKGAKKFGNLLF